MHKNSFRIAPDDSPTCRQKESGQVFTFAFLYFLFQRLQLAVMQSFELCKPMVTQVSISQGFVALEGLRASHN